VSTPRWNQGTYTLLYNCWWWPFESKAVAHYNCSWGPLWNQGT